MERRTALAAKSLRLVDHHECRAPRYGRLRCRTQRIGGGLGIAAQLQPLDASDEQVFTYIAANDEHGMLDAQLARYDDTDALLGRRILLPPGHCDPTVNLYDEYVCHRNGQVVEIWPIDARGLSR